MSITVEFRECSLPLTWTLTLTRIANTEPKSVTGAYRIARVRIRTRTFSPGTWRTCTRTTDVDPWPFNETLACTRTHTLHKKNNRRRLWNWNVQFSRGCDLNCVPKDGGWYVTLSRERWTWERLSLGDSDALHWLFTAYLVQNTMACLDWDKNGHLHELLYFFFSVFFFFLSFLYFVCLWLLI